MVPALIQPLAVSGLQFPKKEPPMSTAISPARPLIAPPADTPDSTYRGLRNFNLVMGFLHLVQGILMIVISNDTTYPIYTNFLGLNLQTRSLQPNPQLAYELPFGIAVAIFLLISAIAHFYLGTIGYTRYVNNLKLGMNPIRFYEYALSSSWMIVLIGLLVGVWDMGALILMFGINAMMNLFGIMMELHNQTTTRINWSAFIYGCLAGIVPWIVIVVYFVGSINSSAAKPPSFVYAIIPTIFVFFNIFAINMLLQYKQVGPWKNYLFGERIYIVLSLLAKTALAWMIWFGTLAPV
jgi:Heliorhodopsin